MTCRFVFVLALTLAVTSGCEDTHTRAHMRSAAFAKLSADDQRLVLRGSVQKGMNADAVYIAWGEPDESRITGTDKEETVRWRYHRQLTVKAPFGSYDQFSYGNSVFSLATVPLARNAGFGFGGVGNEGELLYQPHLQIADETVKEAYFRNGTLRYFRVYQSEFTLPR